MIHVCIHVPYVLINTFCFSMHIVPSSHGMGIYKHMRPSSSSMHVDYGMMEIPKPDDVRNSIIMHPLAIGINMCIMIIVHCIIYYKLLTVHNRCCQ